MSLLTFFYQNEEIFIAAIDGGIEVDAILGNEMVLIFHADFDSSLPKFFHKDEIIKKNLTFRDKKNDETDLSYLNHVVAPELARYFKNLDREQYVSDEITIWVVTTKNMYSARLDFLVFDKTHLKFEVSGLEGDVLAFFAFMKTIPKDMSFLEGLEIFNEQFFLYHYPKIPDFGIDLKSVRELLQKAGG